MQRLTALALVFCLLPSVCLGNLSGPWKPGQLMVDVEGVKDVAIVRETLRIDLRPLEHARYIRISATYVVEHVQSARDLPLTFITGADSVRSVTCRWNGQPLAFTTRQVLTMPESWKPPDSTPGFVPEELLLYSRNLTDTQHEWILFTVPVQTGRQTIEVTYEVEAGAYYSSYSTAKYWQTAYILSPARTWKSFGGLDLEVLAPANWPVKSNLPLTNDGERWTARFDSLPADFITFTTQHPGGKRVPTMDLVDSLLFFTVCVFLLGLKHCRHRYDVVKQADESETFPKCTHNHFEWLLVFIWFLPLAWNGLWILGANRMLPDIQVNYQLMVIHVFFQAIYWIVILAVLLLCSRGVLQLLCGLGTRTGRSARTSNCPSSEEVSGNRLAT